MKKTLRQQIDELAAMDVRALQARHLEFFGKETTSTHRQYLFRKLTWHLQAKTEGGLPPAAIEFARSIVATRRSGPESWRMPSAGARDCRWTSHRPTIEPGHDARTPMPGGLIVEAHGWTCDGICSPATGWPREFSFAATASADSARSMPPRATIESMTRFIASALYAAAGGQGPTYPR